MGEFRLEIGSETECQKRGAAVLLSSETCPGCSSAAPHRLTFEEFFIELEQGRMLDARQGGLVVGRSGPEDDIPMYRHFGRGIFEVVGLMQGGEFIVSKLATEKHRDWLEEINQETGEWPADLSLEPSPVASIINTNLLPEWGGLWISYQFVVNRFATAKWLDELLWRNATANDNNVVGQFSR
ncbi:hypothetical protein ACLMJV_31045 [Sinorhizobium meliloti]|uniref:hypothetical protein n=1 Tax=Rhizobium meliloti TaxID=382 RepID=UPI00398CC789